MYKTGDRIRHERYGTGTVTDVATVDGFQRGWIEWDDADSDAYRGTWALDSATFRPEPTRAVTDPAGMHPCRNDACPDPGPHAHAIDSRDDLEAARWAGYTPLHYLPTEVLTPADRAAIRAAADVHWPGDCTQGDACDGCPRHDR